MVLLFGGVARSATAAEMPRYYGHATVADEHGVIAPWYTGLNGQCDFRVRVAVETLKRYPWKAGPDGVSLPDYINNGRWSIAVDGTITPGKLTDWGNGDLVQRGTYAMFGWLDDYRYTGDPAAIAHISLIADMFLDRCQTGPDHPWPGFIISVPNRGQPYGPCDPTGMIQLDLSAMAGLGLTHAYELTGNTRWLDAAKHWADVFAEKRSREQGTPPWNRYANPQDVFWNDLQTGGVVWIVRLMDELIRVGYTGRDNAIIDARDAGRAYLQHLLDSCWLANDTWGRDYWDWSHQVMSETIAEVVPRYLMQHPDLFPLWQSDARNIMTLYHMRACASRESYGDVFHGAWAYPEGIQCCDRSLSYPPMQVGAALAEYGVRADSAWAREMARRQFILATYDAQATGVVEDNIDGGPEVAGSWLQIAHPLPLDYVLDAIAWLPESLGASRENHIVRSSAIVSRVQYEPGRVSFTTFDAPPDTTTVLRLAMPPTQITADGKPLPQTPAIQGNGYSVQPLANGDCIVTVQHEGHRTIVIEGNDDPQQSTEDGGLSFAGVWSVRSDDRFSGNTMHTAADAGATMTFRFHGNQVRVIGSVSPEGGLADVFIDDAKHLCGIDYWNPYRLDRCVVYSQNGLSDGEHTLKLVAAGQGNPRSAGSQVTVDAVQHSAATGSAGFGAGGGPTGTQRWVLGYPDRRSYVDSQGHEWQIGTEVVIRQEGLYDPVDFWYTQPRRQMVAGTNDPVLYRHGIHGKDFTLQFTVAPGRYHARLKFMETRVELPEHRAINIYINDQLVAGNVDLAATATGQPSSTIWASPNGTKIYAGLNTAVDLVFNDIAPKNGMIAIRLTGTGGNEAILSAAEIGPGDGGTGAQPVPVAVPTSAPGFRDLKP